ncbi:YhgE/Pip domain-containing protein [Bacillus marasmi]|uniref:YhgE/Pip domain-containing protein n=1 Tax=Bacillus marasmi TaxID=1926279 RepID=UPI0011CC4FB9|nr:YhgE/Pip domain-containing protein [Bacillus marasmi]
MKQRLMYQEWLSIFQNKKVLIPVIAILFIPVLYAGMFLWAFWDPYARLNELPVVVINEDQGATFEGKALELGKDLSEKLADSDEFEFHISENKTKAKEDLKGQEYYMMIQIPSDFSENATTLLDENPQKLELVYIPNEGYNFLSAQIGNTAIEKLKASISEKVSETYAETMFDKVGALADGMVAASDGAAKIDEGALSLKDGTESLHESLKLLASKAVEFQTGMTKANTGTKDLQTGAATLASGLKQLEDGHEKLQNASNELLAGEEELGKGIAKSKQGIDLANSKMPEILGGTEELQKGTEKLLKQVETSATTTSSSAQKINEGILSLQKQLTPLLSQLPTEQQAALNDSFAQLAAGSKAIADGNAYLADMMSSPEGGDKLTSGLSSLMDGQTQLQSGIEQLADGSSLLQAGSNKIITGQKQFNSGMETYSTNFATAKNGALTLASGTNELSSGMTQLSDGTDKIIDGTGQLTDGAERVAAGNAELKAGTEELASKLTEGANQASKVDGNEETFSMFASPVGVKNEKMNEVPNYGTGFTPYFLSLGLFVGALLLSIVFPLREPVAVPKSGWSWFMSKFGVISIIGIIQALIAVAIIYFGLGIEVQNVPLFILFAIGTSLTFITLIQVLVTTMSDVGRFVAILILILQLTTSAGTFPLELIPEFLQGFNTLLPMTYSVQGFKAVISSGDFSFMWMNFGVLIGFILLFIAGTVTYFNFKHKRSYSAFKETFEEQVAN